MQSSRRQKFQYPHPIIKSFESISQQSHHNQPSAYQIFHTPDPNLVSYKMLRSTHIEPLMGSPFSLLLHPLHPKVEINSYESKNILTCKKCNSIVNTTSILKISLLKHKCKYCGHMDESEFGSGRFVDSNVFDNFKSQISDESKPRKILFTIQANQLLYNKHITSSIFNCLRAFTGFDYTYPKLDKSVSDNTESSSNFQQRTDSIEQDKFWGESLEIGFLFFDHSRNYVLNLCSNQIVIIEPKNFLDQFALTQKEIFKPLNSIDLEDLQQIINQIMYGSFLNKKCCLIETLNLCNMFAQKWKTQTKLFTCTHDINIGIERVNNKNNKSVEVKNKIDPRVRIYLMQNNLYGYLNSLGLSENICYSYYYDEICQTQLYYDIYHNLSQQTHYNVQINISTSQLIQCSKKKLIVPILTTNTPIILDFHIPINSKNKHLFTLQHIEKLNNQSIQLRFDFGSVQRVVTYSVPKINYDIINEPYLLNDEAFFFVMISKLLMDKNMTSLKKSIANKSKQIVDRILKIEEQSFHIPKNLVNFFMYAFMIMQHDIYDRKSPNFLSSRSRFLKEGLETTVKQIYPKVYEFYPKMVPLKFRPKSFLHDSIRLVDNGKFIGIVIGDQVKQSILLQLFGSNSLESVIFLQEVPHLENSMNQKLIQGIEILRNANQLYYLPLKFIDFCSREYQQLYGSYLYIQQDHRKFFATCYKS